MLWVSFALVGFVTFTACWTPCDCNLSQNNTKLYKTIHIIWKIPIYTIHCEKDLLKEFKGQAVNCSLHLLHLITAQLEMYEYLAYCSFPPSTPTPQVKKLFCGVFQGKSSVWLFFLSTVCKVNGLLNKLSIMALPRLFFFQLTAQIFYFFFFPTHERHYSKPAKPLLLPPLAPCSPTCTPSSAGESGSKNWFHLIPLVSF